MQDEGGTVFTPDPFVSLENCKTVCDGMSGCNSIAFCESGPTDCWLKDKVVTLADAGKDQWDVPGSWIQTRGCHTYIKSSYCPPAPPPSPPPVPPVVCFIGNGQGFEILR